MDLNGKSLRVGEKKSGFATGIIQTLISQHTNLVPFLLPLPSVKWEVMNPLSLLYHLTARVIIFWTSWTSLRKLRKECIFALSQTIKCVHADFQSFLMDYAPL